MDAGLFGGVSGVPLAYLDLDAFRSAPLRREPFDNLVLPRILSADAFLTLEAVFPDVPGPGSFPLSSLKLDPTFAAFMEELQGEGFRRAIEDKFSIGLANRPCSITIRGEARTKDGAVHTDSKSKLITVLIYMNSLWDEEGGRLRLLRSPDLADSFEEIAPVEGALVAFRRSETSWHGHQSCQGQRRVIQLNWLTDEETAGFESRRHRFSASIKKWTGGLRRSIGL